MYGPDFRFTSPREWKEGNEDALGPRPLDLAVAPLPFHTAAAAAGRKVLFGVLASAPLSLSLSLSPLPLGVVRSRSCSPVVALPVADYRRRTCHRRRLLFRKSETIAPAGVCLTEVPRLPGGCAPRIYIGTVGTVLIPFRIISRARTHAERAGVSAPRGESRARLIWKCYIVYYRV